MSARFILLTFFLTTLIVSSTFQNCAKVNFEATNEESHQGTAEASEVPDEADVTRSGTSNGDAYSGKVTRYIHWSQPGECGVREIVEKSVILEEDSQYALVKQDCLEIDPTPLSSDDVSIINAETIQYTAEEYTLILPTSCEEIFNLGGADGNGLYYIDPDGPSGAEYISVYCEMDIISGGWTPWTIWSECSELCGGGEQRRIRTCETGSCRGPTEEVQSCNSDPC